MHVGGDVGVILPFAESWNAREERRRGGRKCAQTERHDSLATHRSRAVKCVGQAVCPSEILAFVCANWAVIYALF